jgi:DNA (cytosine-5)-methyltransferase 1
MRVLDLFSGIGGFSIGLESVGMETVAFCEQNAYCQKILAQHWPTLPIHSDITELSGYEYRGSVELVCGGFPCQPFSVAGERRGKEDDRALWSEMLRVIREVAPRWVIGENVPGIIPMELDTVLSDLEGEGYTCWTFVLPACAVDAPHRRDRVWVIAHTNSEIESDGSVDAETPRRVVANTSGYGGRNAQGSLRRQDSKGKWTQNTDQAARSSEDVSNTNGSGLQRREEAGNLRGIGPGRDEQSERCFDNAGAVWLPEPNVGRVADAVPNRSHRLKALGNAVVPPLVAEIGRLVMEFDREIING